MFCPWLPAVKNVATSRTDLKQVRAGVTKTVLTEFMSGMPARTKHTGDIFRSTTKRTMTSPRQAKRSRTITGSGARATLTKIGDK